MICPFLHTRTQPAANLERAYSRFTGVVIRPDGSRYSDVLDIGVVGPDGRIVRIISFHGPLSDVPATWPVELTQDPTVT